MPTQMNTQWASPAWAISWCGPSLRPDPTSQVGAARWLAGRLAGCRCCRRIHEWLSAFLNAGDGSELFLKAMSRPGIPVALPPPHPPFLSCCAVRTGVLPCSAPPVHRCPRPAARHHRPAGLLLRLGARLHKPAQVGSAGEALLWCWFGESGAALLELGCSLARIHCCAVGSPMPAWQSCLAGRHLACLGEC